MHFLINLFNHSGLGQLSLQDVISLIGRQLEALGHTAKWSNDGLYTAEGTCNILVEGFAAFHIDRMRQCKEAGGKIIIIATEEPTPQGFNHGILPDMVRRQATFHEAAQYADAIWYLVPGCGDWYGQFGVPAAYLDLGFSPNMMRVDPGVNIDHDFGFFGSITPRRDKILEQFAKTRIDGRRAKVRWVQFSSCFQRDMEIARCRVVLQIRAHDEMGLISNSRCCTSLHIGRPVIAEHHANPGAWTKIIEFAPSGLLIHRAVAMRKRWRDAYAQQFERFITLLSPERCAGRALSETLDAVKVAA